MSEAPRAKRHMPFGYRYSSLLADPLEAVLKDSNVTNEMLAQAGKKVSEYCRHSYGTQYAETHDYFGVLDYFTHDAWVRIAIPWQIPGRGTRPSPGLERPVRITSSSPVPESVVRSLCNGLALELAPYRALPPRSVDTPKPL